MIIKIQTHFRGDDWLRGDWLRWDANREGIDWVLYLSIA